jgi:acyl-CoA synthetase (AMP-forming)/AMP-acid ligase II
MIISGGVNIYPQETEDVLTVHPKVLDAAVIGVPNDDLGEEVKAVVQLVDPAEASPRLAEELIEYCQARLAAYKCPRSVDFVDELPREPNGKLYKRFLKDRYWSGHATRIV